MSETVATRVADPVVAALTANGVTVIVAAPAVELPAATEIVAAEPVVTPAARVTIVEVASPTVCEGTVIVHVTGVA